MEAKETKATEPNLPKHINKLKKICGIEKATCETCECGYAEHDGDHGEIYCGVCCRRIKEDTGHCHVEDADLDIATEKDCWEPNFWCSKFTDIIDGTEESMQEASRQFQETVKGVLGDIQK